jgi:hypothetical protein
MEWDRYKSHISGVRFDEALLDEIEWFEMFELDDLERRYDVDTYRDVKHAVMKEDDIDD